ncbi:MULTISPECIES: hypothetical protein [Acinetobacter]|uniref:Uncharacterized protein n=1 Tax=Acinetobacter indicus TaxID=756892 RepID=A0A6C0Y7J1_9GAMM|nr:MULTISPECIES: hypothetical protein [Acinetobacter]QIC72079.1 hypothetical protein FSC09_17120 [Acinetobacter indicus]QKQ71520.1 hypothetical protein E5Y90_14910 [Acinetobacter sp. 10FS3-1]
MSATTLKSPNIFSAESIRDAIGSIIQSIQQRTSIKETNLVLDADLSRSLSIAHYVFNDFGLDYEYTASGVLFMTDKALKKLATTELVSQFRDEVIKQFEVLRHYFRSIPNHGYALAVANQTHENNVYGLAKWLADHEFSMSKTVSDAFNVFNAHDLKDWLKTPLNIDSAQNEVFLAVLLDILSCYSYSELTKILKA